MRCYGNARVFIHFFGLKFVFIRASAKISCTQMRPCELCEAGHFQLCAVLNARQMLPVFSMIFFVCEMNGVMTSATLLRISQVQLSLLVWISSISSFDTCHSSSMGDKSGDMLFPSISEIVQLDEFQYLYVRLPQIISFCGRFITNLSHILQFLNYAKRLPLLCGQ